MVQNIDGKHSFPVLYNIVHDIVTTNSNVSISCFTELDVSVDCIKSGAIIPTGYTPYYHKPALGRIYVLFLVKSHLVGNVKHVFNRGPITTLKLEDYDKVIYVTGLYRPNKNSVKYANLCPAGNNNPSVFAEWLRSCCGNYTDEAHVVCGDINLDTSPGKRRQIDTPYIYEIASILGSYGEA